VLGFTEESIEPAAMNMDACWPAAATLSALSSASRSRPYKKSMDSIDATDRIWSRQDRWLRIALVHRAIAVDADLTADFVFDFAFQSLVVS